MSTKATRQFMGMARSMLPFGSMGIVALLALALAMTGSSAQAAGRQVAYESPSLASGDLDTTFSGDGKLQTIFTVGRSAKALKVAIQPDGKIVATGLAWLDTSRRNIGIARYKANGILDTTFSADGKNIIELGGYYDDGKALAIHASTGKIIVAGQKCTSGWLCDSAVLRLYPGGALDPTFSGDGKRLDDFGGNDTGSLAAAVYPDGKILLGGFKWNSVSGNYDFALIRYLPGGGLDTSFSADGKVAVAFGSTNYDWLAALAIQPDGKILAGGSVCDSADHCNFALARLNSNGTLDSTFSGDGKNTTDFGFEETAEALALQSDGRIILAGWQSTGSTTYFALARYNTNGSLDASFGGDGKVITNFSKDANPESIESIRVQPDGKIIACGVVFSPTGTDFAVARYTPSGNLDLTFSSDGKVKVDFGMDDHCVDIAVQSDGKYVLAGYSNDGALSNWSLARIWP